ncbi:hypothetical protein D9M69_654250 [compost metagenome]
MCSGFQDIIATLEDTRTVTFIATGFDASLPKKSTEGGQVLGIAIDNVRGEVQRRVDAANQAGEAIQIIYRTFIESDLSAPADPPYYLDALRVSLEGPTASISAGYFDLLNTAWPRERYNTTNAPGITYIA